MKIIDLEEKDTKSYFVCLEDWSDEINTFDRKTFMEWGIVDAL